jgi:hypothetical protein
LQICFYMPAGFCIINYFGGEVLHEEETPPAYQTPG